MTRLNAKFNTAAVKKGDTFQIELTGGGLMNLVWETRIVSGKATLVNVDGDRKGIPCAPVTQRMTYRADEAGEIEILAQAKRGGAASMTFKVRVA